MSTVTRVTGLSNQEFLAQHARAGRIGLVGGNDLFTRLIARAQRHAHPERQWSLWSHAFLFQGERADGRQWVIESDMEIHRRHIRLGVQENRVDKFFDDETYTTMAVLDLGLSDEQVRRVIGCALDLAVDHTRYSLREIAGTLWALRHPEMRPEENLLARERAYFCSAFVRHIFRTAGLELAPGISEKNTTPEDIFRAELVQAQWLLIRRRPASKVRKAVRRLRARLRLLR